MHVIFDFGGVLLRWEPQEVVDRMFADPRVRDTVMQSIFRHPDWIELDRGTLAEPDAVARFAARTGVPHAEIARLMQSIRESLTPLPDSVALLRELARRGVPLYGLSNMPAGSFRFLQERYDFWSLFKGIVISGEVGLIKPDPRIFAHLASCYGLSYQDAVFIDDHDANIATGKALGLHTVLFKDCRSCAAELYALLARSQ